MKELIESEGWREGVSGGHAIAAARTYDVVA